MKSYLDMYLSLYEGCGITYNIANYPIRDILDLFHCSKLSFDDDEKLLSLLNSISENSFNSGFDFAMKIFSNNL